jgi:predicted RNase H-like nuclease
MACIQILVRIDNVQDFVVQTFECGRIVPKHKKEASRRRMKNSKYLKKIEELS